MTESDNTVSLKEYVDTRFNALELSLDKANQVLNARLETMNEFRGQMKDQTATFITRVEFEAKHDSLYNRIESIQKIVYMGLGALTIIEFLFKFLIK